MSDFDNQEYSEMLDAMKEDKENQKGAKKKYWSPPSDKEGTFTIRILPPIKKNGEKRFYFSHSTHWINRTPYECLNQHLVDKYGNEHEPEKCPACEYAKKLFNTSERDSDEWRLASSISAKPRYVYRVIVRGKDDETQPEFYETGKTVFNLLFHIMTETDYGIIVDPKNGRDFNLTKNGTGRRSRYDQSLPAAEKTPLFKDSDKFKAVIKNMQKLEYSSLIEFSSKKEMNNAIKEHLGMEVEEEDETPVPPKKKKAEVKEEEDDNDELFASEDVEDDDEDIDKILEGLDA